VRLTTKFVLKFKTIYASDRTEFVLENKEHLPAVGFDVKAEGCWDGSGVTAQAHVLRHKSVTIVHRRLEMSDELVQHQACSNKEKYSIKVTACW